MCVAVICCLYIPFCVSMCRHFNWDCGFVHQVFSQPVWTNGRNQRVLLHNLICSILCLSYFTVTNGHLLAVNGESFYIMPLQETSVYNHCYVLVKVMVLHNNSALPWQNCGRFSVLKCAFFRPGTMSTCCMFANLFNKFLHFIPICSLLFYLTILCKCDQAFKTVMEISYFPFLFWSTNTLA